MNPLSLKEVAVQVARDIAKRQGKTDVWAIREAERLYGTPISRATFYRIVGRICDRERMNIAA